MAEVRWNNAEFGQLPSVAVAAHELKSPLALIRQLSLLLEEGLLDAAETRRIAQQLSSISDQSLALVQDLAQTAHLSPTLFPLEPINPLALCQQMAMELHPMLRLYGQSIVWPKKQSAKRLVVANRALLSRILANFLNNSLKYSEKDMPIRVTIRQIGSTLRILIRDHGPMMSRADYARLIDEMEQRKSVRTRPDSSGLGVYVASQFAKAMGGTIGLIRHRDGLTFYVELPISQQMSLL